MTVYCLSCKQPFKDYRELANHIMGSPKTTHSQGRKWAAMYQHRHLLKKRNFPEGSPLTEEDKANKEQTSRILSGKTVLVNTICPQCKTPSSEILEVEYIKNPNAWRINKKLVKLCRRCLA